MREATFTDPIVLLHLGRLPSPGERRLLDAILIGVADHGAGAPSCAAARLAASGNRQSLSAAIAAGVLTIGDEHGGAGANLHGADRGEASRSARGRRTRTGRGGAARRRRKRSRAKRRLPGSAIACTRPSIPRVAVLFELARQEQRRRRRHRLHAGARSRGRRAHQAAPDEYRRRPRRGPARHGLPAAARHAACSSSAASPGLTAEVAEEYAREKPMRIKFDVDYDGVPPEPE